MANPYGDFRARGGGGSMYIKFNDGETKTLRIASEPYYRLTVWDDADKEYLDQSKVASMSEDELDGLDSDRYKVSERFSWVVLDRTEKNSPVAGILESGVTVFGQIQTLANNPKWGDPNTKHYDLDITRRGERLSTEYIISPDPERAPLSDAEQELVAAVDIVRQVKGARPLSEVVDAEKVGGKGAKPVDEKEIPDVFKPQAK